MMDPRTAQDIPGQVLADIQADRARSQSPETTTTAPDCSKPIRGRTRRSPEERLAQLQARAEQLEARLKAKRRRAETREKIILGGWVRALCRGDGDQVRIMDFLGRFAASRHIEVPKAIREEVTEAMRQAAAAKTAPKQGGETR